MSKIIGFRRIFRFVNSYQSLVAFKKYSMVSQSSIYAPQKPCLEHKKTNEDQFLYKSSLFKCFLRHAKGSGGKKMKASKKKFSLSDEEMLQVVNVEAYRNHLDAILNKMKLDFVQQLSTRPATGVIDDLPVKIDEEEYPLKELAQISRKNPNLIAINMAAFPDGLKPALQAITESGIGINPQQEGTMIYLPVPKMTREHREKLAKNAKAMFVKVKDEIRKTQNNFVKEVKGKTDISEDLIFSASEQLISIADAVSSDAEKIMKNKQNELLNEK